MRPALTLSLMLASGAFAILPAAAKAQGAPAKLQTLGTPQAADGPATGAALAGGSPAAGPPVLLVPLPAPPGPYQPRPSLQCADFKRSPGGGWSALSPIRLPGPQGPVQLLAGQSFADGDYVGGMDMGSVLERDCRGAPPP